MACISVVFSPVLPSMSITSPRGFFSSSGHDVMRATALSPVLPPRSLPRGMIMSVARNLESVTSTPNCFSTRSVPMNVCSFCSSISTTSASVSTPRRLAATITRTLSPLRACMELRSATNIDSPSSSVTTEFLPLERRTNVPVDTLPRCGALYLPGDTSSRSPSNASSASCSAMVRCAAGVSSSMA